jgi:hypothetical protein
MVVAAVLATFSYANGEALIELVPRGGTGNEISVLPGSSVIVDVFISDVAPTLVQGYQASVAVQASGGDSGTVAHDGNLPVIDSARPDFVFAGGPAFTQPGLGPPPTVLAFVINSSDAVEITTPAYGGEFTYVVSNDAIGEFTIELTGLDQQLTSLLDDNSQPIPFGIRNATVRVICLGDEDCDDGLFCNGQETCVDAACVDGTPPCPQPDLPFCDENLDACVECLSAAECVDGIECTDDVCSLGVCSNPPLTAGTPCGDDTDTDCTDPDTCDGAGACQINDAPNGTSCADGLFCTTGETCTDGVCGGGGPTDCSDEFPCTEDICNEDANQCEHPLFPDTCLIDGACFDAGDPNPFNECETCDPAQSTTTWSVLPDDTPCTPDGNDCTDDVCLGGFCEHPNSPVGTSCDDGNPCTGTGRPEIGFDECDGDGNCVGTLDPDCADDCPNAVEAFDGTNTGTNQGFGPDLVEASCQPNSNHDAWFVYTALCDGDVLMNTDGSNFLPSNDTVLSVLDECDGTEVACDDDSGNQLLSSLVVFSAIAGEDYFIRVAGFGDNQGDITLNIVRLDTCFIEGQCVAADTANPASECQLCDPSNSTTDWSPRPVGTPCGDPGSGECDNPDACNAAGECEANNKPDGTVCTEDGNECTDDICLAGLCENPPQPEGFACGDPFDSECDNPDTCDGAGTCLDNLEPPGFACGDPTDTDCDNPDTCDGAGTCELNLEPDGTACTDDGNDCTQDFCDVGACIHPDEPVDTPCGDPNDTQCDNPDTCDGLGVCLDNNEADGLPCDDENVCTGPDECLAGACDAPFIPEAPVVATLSSRSLEVTAQPGGSPVEQALRVTSPDFACLLKYVDATGQLTDTPVYQTPDVWGTIEIWGNEMIPSATYTIAAECGGDVSNVGTASTTKWADLTGDDVTNLFDVFCILEGIEGNFSNCSLRQSDIEPCTPNGVLNLLDVFAVLMAIEQAGDYPCAGPCGSGACCVGESCTITANVGNCLVEGGVFQGAGVDCLPNPCTAASPVSNLMGARNDLPIIRPVPDRRRVKPGERFTVDLFVSGLADVRGYELSIDAAGGASGSLLLEEISVDVAREDYVFRGLDDARAIDLAGGRVVNLALHDGVPALEPTYLGTVEFRATRDAAGTFDLQLPIGGGLHVLDSSGRAVNVLVEGTTIDVGVRGVRQGREVGRTR